MVLDKIILLVPYLCETWPLRYKTFFYEIPTAHKSLNAEKYFSHLSDAKKC